MRVIGGKWSLFYVWAPPTNDKYTVAFDVDDVVVVAALWENFFPTKDFHSHGHQDFWPIHWVWLLLLRRKTLSLSLFLSLKCSPHKSSFSHDLLPT